MVELGRPFSKPENCTVLLVDLNKSPPGKSGYEFISGVSEKYQLVLKSTKQPRYLNEIQNDINAVNVASNSVTLFSWAIQGLNFCNGSVKESSSLKDNVFTLKEFSLEKGKKYFFELVVNHEAEFYASHPLELNIVVNRRPLDIAFYNYVVGFVLILTSTILILLDLIFFRILYFRKAAKKLVPNLEK